MLYVGAEIRRRAAVRAVAEPGLPGAAGDVVDLDDAADVEWGVVEEARAEFEVPEAGRLVVAGERVWLRLPFALR